MFRVTVINDTFTACNNNEWATESDANSEAIRGALEIGVEEIGKGKSFFGAEVKVERPGGSEVLSRFVISVGVSPLQ